MQFQSILKEWLRANRITDKMAEDFNVSFDSDRIVFPVHDHEGNFLFNKYRRSPTSEDGPKYTYDKGGKVSLYGYHLAKEHDSILCVEGEKDCLVAWSHNIPAVTSTGGAMTLQEDWRALFVGQGHIQEDNRDMYFPENKEVTICFDSDDAGAQGMVKALEVVPWAKVMLIPDMPNVKDVSDYVNMGGNLHELLKTARHFADIAEVAEDRSRRIAIFQSVRFHDAYIKAHTKVNAYKGERKAYDSDKVTNAKGYPIPSLLKFNGLGKAICPFHNERTPSLQYYPKDNRCYCFGGCGKSYDAISIYMILNDVGFKQAVDNLNAL